MLDGSLSRPAGSISKAPHEGEVGPSVDPAAHRDGLVRQDRGLVDQPVELHGRLDQDRVHVGGKDRLTPGRHGNDIVTTPRQILKAFRLKVIKGIVQIITVWFYRKTIKSKYLTCSR